MSGPGDLTPREAVSRYLDQRRPEISAGTFSTYRYRLKLFVEWCEREGISSVCDLDGWTIDEFRAHRAGKQVSPNTLHNEMDTLRLFAEYLDRIEVTDDLGETVEVPEVPPGERSREEKLDPDQGVHLLKQFRASDERGGRFHTVLEIAWHTAARIGGIRALDLRDFHPEEAYLSFRHRPSTDTPLKKKLDGERDVAIRPEVVQVIQKYLRNYRIDDHDQHGRQPLFVSAKRNRASASALRSWMYQATYPCRFNPCPHGFDPPTCQFKEHQREAGCPSTRSPHHVRTGAMTWHRDRGVPRDVLSERANAAESTIEEFYDKATKRERMENRRREYVANLDLDDDTDD